MSAVSRIESDPIGLFVPQAEGEERALRKRLHNARTLAAAKAVGATLDEARALYWIVNETASAWVFAPAALDDLRDITGALVNLFTVAGTFERIGGGQS